ncbi:MAG: hypothetical protein RJA41_974, partial [Actinomycetota bacterium]
MVKIAVLVKQVPSADSRLTLNQDTFLLERSLTDPVLNPADLHAVEAALRISDGTDSQTYLISMGPAGVEQSTKRALAMGIDEAFHVTDSALSGADIWVTANVLASAIKKTGAELVIAGSNSSDAQNAVVPAFVAGLLGWDFAYVENELELDQVLNLKQPAVIVANSKLNSPRLPNFKGIAAAKTKPVTVFSLTDLEMQSIAPKVKVVSQQLKDNTQTQDKKTGTVQELATLISNQITKWSEIDSSSEIGISETEEVKVFEHLQKDLAAKHAASIGAGLITDVSHASEAGFTK